MSNTKKLIIAAGPSNSGKSTFSKDYAKKKGATYIDFDLIFDYRSKNGFISFIKKLRSLIEKNSENFVMDGYPIEDAPSLKHLEDELGVDIETVLCFAAPNVIKKRQEKHAKDPLSPKAKTKEFNQKIIEWYYFVLNYSPYPLKLIDTTKDFLEEVSSDKFPQRWRELLLISDLEDMPHDKYYHDIYLPSGLKIKGYSSGEETWERLSSLVNFKNKTVIDYGPFHGFMDFKIEKAGADKVLGVEKDENAFKMAQRISWLKNSKVIFYNEDIQTFKAPRKFDIAMVLNMLHHVPDQKKALNNVFSSANMVLFEIPVQQEDDILKVARENNFKKETEINSHREGRKIIVVKNKDGVEVNKEAENKYEFSYTKYKLQKIWKRIKSSKLLYPVKIVVRKYRQGKLGMKK